MTQVHPCGGTLTSTWNIWIFCAQVTETVTELFSLDSSPLVQFVSCFHINKGEIQVLLRLCTSSRVETHTHTNTHTHAYAHGLQIPGGQYWIGN